LELYLSLYAKINSRWIRALYVKKENIKRLKGKDMFVISEWGKPLLKKDLKPRRLKENIDRFDYMKTLKQIKKQQL